MTIKLKTEKDKKEGMERQMIYILVSISAILLIIIYLFYLDKKRREGIQKLAQQWGFSYRKGPENFGMNLPGNLGQLYQQNALVSFLTRAMPKKVNICTGRKGGIETEFFDLRITRVRQTSKGRRSSTSTYQTVVLTLGKALPSFTLAPENLFSRLGESLGGQDIDFPEDHVFSEAYILKGDEATVRKIFDQQTRQAFLSLPVKNVHIGTLNTQLIFKTNSRLNAKKLEEFVNACIKVGKSIQRF